MIKKLKVLIVKFLVVLKVYDFVCCICGKGSRGFGNNADTESEKDRCCDNCNDTVVVPNRMRALGL